MKNFFVVVRVIIALITIFFGACAPYQPAMRQGSGRPQQPGRGQWSRVADGTYTHYRVYTNPLTGETRIENIGVVQANDPEFLTLAKRQGFQVLQAGDAQRVNPSEVPSEIRQRAEGQIQNGFGGYGGQGYGYPGGGYQDGGYPMPRYIPTIPRGMRTWDAHTRGYW